MNSCLFRFCSRTDAKYDGSKKGHEEIPKEISNMSRYLSDINLESNKIKILDKKIFACRKLKRLNLSQNLLSKIPPEIGELTELKDLILSNNHLYSISEEIKLCRELIYLCLSKNYLSKIPDSVMALRNLQYLMINELSLTELPSSISGLCNLKVLEARENLITTIPASISFLSNLIRLDLGCNEITSLPSTIGQLQLLQELYLEENSLKDLCAEIGQLKNLSLLELSKNPLQTLPDDICKLQNLTDLTCSNCQILSLPTDFGKLKDLQVLVLSCNQIQELPDSFCDLKNLTNCTLERNYISRLPENLGNLKKLNVLDLNYNSLTELPLSICDCANLTTLSFRESKIEMLPPLIGNLKKLVILDMCDNRLKFLPYSVSYLTKIKSIWISKIQKKPILPMQIMKDPVHGDVLINILLPQKSLVIRDIGFSDDSIEEIQDFDDKVIEKPEIINPEIKINENQEDQKIDDHANKIQEIDKLCDLNSNEPVINETPPKQEEVTEEKSQSLPQIFINDKHAFKNFSEEEIRIKSDLFLNHKISIEEISKSTNLTYGLTDFNLFITDFEEECCDLRIRIGDRILAINDKAVSELSFESFEQILQNNEEISIKLRHDPPFEFYRTVKVDELLSFKESDLKVEKKRCDSTSSLEMLTIVHNELENKKTRDKIKINDIIVGIDNKETINSSIQELDDFIQIHSPFNLIIFRKDFDS